jgi:hypothetical protein
MTVPDLVSDTAHELLRTALLAKLAVDLGDPQLARRAARYAQSSAKLLAGLDLPTYVEDDDDESLPEVDDLLERMPSRDEVEMLSVTPGEGGPRGSWAACDPRVISSLSETAGCPGTDRASRQARGRA